ncbi:elongation factor-2 kinase [Auriculariales sp. MPI-PUGE-AT-0066]|nr:elongation factor-2 kinase [Auriculariales sp. MPI-PUGE-AT-0066]
MNASARKQLDLVFVQDCTSSQDPYITSATRSIEEICSAIFESGKLLSPEDLRIGLVAYRDHPPEDTTFIIQNFGFSSDKNLLHSNLKTLSAEGGGDGPEAVTAALYAALNMDWRSQASKMVVLIADAPPHGIGESCDGFPNGSPDGQDPLMIARQMASRGITLFVVACEPDLSSYSYAVDFFQALAGMTSGFMLPLTTAKFLAHAIIGSALENLDMARLTREVGQALAERVIGGQASVDDVARELHETLLLRGERTQQVVFKNIYRESEEATHNVGVYQSACNLEAARSLLKSVQGTRFNDKYLAVRDLRYDYSSYRTATSPSIPTALSSSSPSSHEVVTDFSSFSARSASMLGATAAPGPISVVGGRQAISAMRTGRRGVVIDDEDYDEEEGIELREDAITLDQVKRIALQSVAVGLAR